jgi:hypothetical protein
MRDILGEEVIVEDMRYMRGSSGTGREGGSVSTELV